MSWIVVGVDGSEPSTRALEWAATEARLREIDLEVVYAYDETPEWQSYGQPFILEALAMEGLEGSSADDARKSETEMAKQHALALIRSMLSDEVTRGLTFRSTVVDDHRPAHYLVDCSRDAAMLVVGSRGRGSMESLLLGSVSNYCVHHAQCPVVVIK